MVTRKALLVGLLLGLMAGFSGGLGISMARADTDSYLSRVHEEIPNVLARYGSDALVAEGQKVCDWAAQGVPDVPEGVTRIVNDMPMSRDAAITLQTLAEDELGC